MATIDRRGATVTAATRSVLDPTGLNDSTGAINAFLAAGGGILLAGTYKISSTIIVPSHSCLIGFAPGAVLFSWAGAGNTDIVQTPSGTTNAQIENLIIDANGVASPTGLHLIDTQRSRFTSIIIQSTGAASSTGIGVRLQAGSGGSGGTFNTVFNVFNQIKTLQYAIGLQLDGITTGPTVTTLNTFTQLDLEQITTAGINLSSWCDSNSFYHVRIETQVSNSVGLLVNGSGNPLADLGVYNNNFYSLAIDAFGGPTSVSGVLFNVSKETFIHGLFAGTAPWPGTLLNDNNGYSNSHWVSITDDGSSTNRMLIRSKRTGLTGETALIGLSNGLNSNVKYFDQKSRVSGPTGSFSVGGFVPNGGWAPTDGDRIYLYNPTGQQMTIVNADASSSAANRINTLTGANVVLRSGNSFVTFSYDGFDSVWILENQNG